MSADTSGVPAGTRIELIEMPNDPSPLPPGSKGTVVEHVGKGTKLEQLWMQWDCGSRLNLLPGVDRFKVIDDGSR